MKPQLILLVTTLIAAQAAAQMSKVHAELVEMRPEGTTRVAHPAESVFDTRNLLKLRVWVDSPGSAAAGDQTTNIARLKRILDLAEEYADKANDIYRLPNAAQEVEALANKVLQLLPTDEERRKVLDLGLAPDRNAPMYVVLVRGLRFYAEEQLNLIASGIRARSVSGAGGKFNIKVTVVQSRELRQGRTYAKDLQDLLAVTQAERDLAAQLTPEQLEKKLNEWKEDVTKLVSKAKDDLQQPIQRLKDKVGDQNQVYKDLKLLADDFSGINAESLILGAAYRLQTLIKDLDNLRPMAQIEVDAVLAVIKDFAVQVKAYVEARLNFGRIEEIARQVREFILGEGEERTLLIGQSSAVQTADVPLTIENGDKLQIVVSAQPEDKSSAEAPVFDKSVRGYKLGTNLVRTVTYDWFYQEGTSRAKAAPAINFLSKKFTRDLNGNTTRNIGLGASWFLLGVDQANSGTNQQAIGPVVSLLDDWVSVGYIRNMSTNKWFWVVGAMLPIRF